jgi:hypothetical protein
MLRISDKNKVKSWDYRMPKSEDGFTDYELSKLLKVITDVYGEDIDKQK